MSTALSASSDQPYGNLWTDNSADTAPQDSQIDLEPISPYGNMLMILFRELSKQYLRDVDRNIMFGDIHKILHHVVPTDQLSAGRVSRESERLNEICHRVMRKMDNSSWYVAGTEPTPRRLILQTTNETRYVKSSLDLENALVDKLNKIFDDARDEIFEDGMNSVFSNNLRRIVKIYGRVAIYALERAIHTDHVNIDVAEEALRQIGNMDGITTHDSRLNLLKNELTSHHPRIRYAASIGIEAMDDVRAIKNLQDAINNEQHTQVRKNFQDVLVQLQDTQ